MPVISSDFTRTEGPSESPAESWPESLPSLCPLELEVPLLAPPGTER